MTTATWTFLVILLVVLWIAQFGMAWMQMKNFYARLRVLRREGLTAVGKSGSQYKGRAYGVLVVDENQVVKRAEKLSGMTVFAKLKPVPQLVGTTLDQILDEPNRFDLSKKLDDAFKHAATELQNAPQEAIDKEKVSPKNAGDVRPSWTVA